MTTRIGSPDTEADLSLRACLDQTPTRSFIMVAGAGSGKTTSLVKALAHLDATKGKTLRRLGQKIACITFTEIAAGEIRGDVGDTPLFHVSTIHSFLWTIVHSFHSDLRVWVAERINEKIAEAQEKIGKPRVHAKTKQKAAEDIQRYTAQLTALAGVTKFNYGTGSKYEDGLLGHDDILRVGPALIAKHALLRTVITKRFPFIFVDESQDTNPTVVSALKEIAAMPGTGFCLGFFGDPMQKIYQAGAGAIEPGEDWNQITKPENFRCPTNVLDVVNRIRAEDDGLVQVPGTRVGPNGPIETPAGTAKLFIFPNIGVDRGVCLERVRAWMAYANNDPLWHSDEETGDVRLLVLVHRIAARRLGFPDLYAALNDNDAPGFKEGLQEGNVWVVRPFLSFVLPLVIGARENNEFEVIAALRRDCPLLAKERVTGQGVAALLTRLKQDVETLTEMMRDDSTQTIRDVLSLIRERELLELDRRFSPYLLNEEGHEQDPEYAAVAALLATPVVQMWGYRRYIENESPFATQQGIKGAQFQRVLVVLDDAESEYRLFSYGKYWGIEPLSDTDRENIAAHEDSVLGRTRRLFYVCCSRAVMDLAVIFFAPNTAAAQAAVLAKGVFQQEDVLLL
jgi:DNA helicase II / ATP-dependent DNA helicase PcrA